MFRTSDFISEYYSFHETGYCLFYYLLEIELFLTILATLNAFKIVFFITNLISHRVYWLLCVYTVYGQTVKLFLFQDMLGSIKAAVQIRQRNKSFCLLHN